MSFKALLQHWQSRVPAPVVEQEFAVRLTVDDAARVLALAEMYGLDKETVITDLLRVALEEVAEAMPYQSGQQVIREDDHGDPVYEDLGPTPRFMELTRARRRDLTGSKDQG